MSTEQAKRHTYSDEPRVISASRRTDIPAFYADWFMRRIEREVVAVPNPNNANQVSWRRLQPGVGQGDRLLDQGRPAHADRWSTWTPRARQARLSLLLPVHPDRAIPGGWSQARRMEMRRWMRSGHLSERSDRTGWCGATTQSSSQPRWTTSWHLEHHRRLAEALDGYTERCVISFLDVFRKTAGNLGRACQARALGASRRR